MHVIDAQNIDFYSEGLKLKVFMAKPREGGRFPLVFVNHGGGGMDYIYEEMCMQLAGWGCVGVCMTFRGYYPSQGRQEYGKGEVVDLLNLLNYFKTKEYIDKSHIGAVGYSRGGHNALLAATRCSEFRALALWSTPVDMFEHYKYHPFLLRDIIGGTPEEVPHEYTARSSINFIHNISCPVLILHGREDEAVPVWHSYRLAEELKRMNKVYKLKIIPGENHSLTERGFNIAWEETIIFFREYLNLELS